MHKGVKGGSIARPGTVPSMIRMPAASPVPGGLTAKIPMEADATIAEGGSGHRFTGMGSSSPLSAVISAQILSRGFRSRVLHSNRRSKLPHKTQRIAGGAWS